MFACFLKQINPYWLIMGLTFIVGEFVLTHISGRMLSSNLGFKYLDKLYHFAAYSVITMVLLKAVKKPVTIKKWIVLALLIALYACLDELTQPFFGRSACPWDYMADLLGMTCAGIFFLVHDKRD